MNEEDRVLKVVRACSAWNLTTAAPSYDPLIALIIIASIVVIFLLTRKKGKRKVECFDKGTSTFDLIETIAPREQKEARESGETEQWYDTSSVGEEMMVVEEEPTTFDLQESSPPGQEEIPTSSV